MPTRRVHALLSLVLLMVTVSRAGAQPSDRVWRVGLLGFESLPASQARALADGLADYGYIEGRNIVIERRSTEGVNERAAKLALELIDLKPDVILTIGGHASHAVKHATATIPIVSLFVSDHVRVGLAKSRAHPGSNLTGMDVVASDLTPKLLELLKEAVPRMSRVAILGVAAAPGHGVLEDPVAQGARVLSLEFYRATVQGRTDYDTALKKIVAGRSDAILVLPDPTNAVMRTSICAFANQHRLPTIGVWAYYPEAGCLMSYGPIRAEVLRRAGYFVDRILRGASPAEIPIEQPTRYELVFNAKTASALALTTQARLKVRADRVLE